MNTDQTPITESALASALLRRRGTRSLARFTYRAIQRATVPIRRSYYVGERLSFARMLPASIRALIGIDDDQAVGSRRLEIGCGPFGQVGFVHADIDAGAPHLEWIAPAWDLPIPSNWAEEIVSIHAVEHLPPAKLVPTLAEWKRVLRPGGRIRIHVPNSPQLMRAFLDAPVQEKWPIMGSLLGMYCGPGATDPRELTHSSDHQLLLDPPLLFWAFGQAGLERVSDLTSEVEDRHTKGWEQVVPNYSLVIEGYKSEHQAASGRQ